MAKKLLNEGTIRRFLKLADMGSVGTQFLEETYTGDVQEENVEESAQALAEEELEEAVLDEEADVDDLDLGGEDDLGVVDDADVEGEAEPANDNEALIRNILSDLQKLAGEVGVDLQLDDTPDEPEPVADLAPEEEVLDEQPLEEEGAACAAEEALEEKVENLEESKKQKLANNILSLLESYDIEVVDDEKIKEDLVKEVTLRVAKRILKEKF